MHARSIVSTTAATLLAVLGSPTLTPPPADAVTTSIGQRVSLVVNAVDTRGDVRFLAHQGISPKDRRSIDIRSVKITDRGPKVRFQVRVADVMANQRDFDQMAFISMKPRRTSGAGWSSTAGFSPQMSHLGYGYWFADSSGIDYETCDPIRSRAKPSGNLIWLDVPNRCLPIGLPMRISVTTYTGNFRSNAGAYSQDTLRLPGVHTVS